MCHLSQKDSKKLLQFLQTTWREFKEGIVSGKLVDSETDVGQPTLLGTLSPVVGTSLCGCTGTQLGRYNIFYKVGLQVHSLQVHRLFFLALSLLVFPGWDPPTVCLRQPPRPPHGVNGTWSWSCARQRFPLSKDNQYKRTEMECMETIFPVLQTINCVSFSLP